VSSPLAIALLVYVCLLALTLAVLAAAKRGDAAMMAEKGHREEPGSPPVRIPEGTPAVAIEAASDPARRLAADVVGALGVERVIVLLHRPGGAAVAACGGVPGVLGQRVPALAGADGAEGARVLLRRTAGGAALSVASVPIEAEGRSIGAVAVGTRRLTPRDLDFLRRLVGRASRQMAGGGLPPSWPDAA
jgi:hypothetical protein